MFDLAVGIAELLGEPARERLAIVVENAAVERKNRALDVNAMAVAIVVVKGEGFAIEHGARGVEARTKRMSEDAIGKGR